MNYFVKGKSIEDMTEDEAVAIFGRPFYESWLESKQTPVRRGTCTVTSIDRSASTITIDPIKRR